MRSLAPGRMRGSCSPLICSNEKQICNRYQANYIIMKNIRYFILVMFVAAFAGCDPWADINNIQDERNKTLLEILVDNPDFSTFVKALENAGYAEKLGSDMSYTVFAPTNDALSGINLSDTAALKVLVQNHISENIAYADITGAFAINRILMLNGKYTTINNNLVSGIPVSQWNIASKNGVLHQISGTIADRKNSWEHLKTLVGNPVVAFIETYNERVMDMNRSIQTGVNANGKPVYDTIWTYRNTLLEALPLADESSTSTYLLLDNSGLNDLKAKYAKYFTQQDSVQMHVDIMREIITDMLLPYTKINTSGRFLNSSEVLIDVNMSDITDSIITSNGIIYKVKSAGVKMYQNKIKPLLIEAEDFVTRWPDAWQTRTRTWASGGRDVVLKSRTRHSYGWPVQTTYELNTKTPSGKDTVVVRDTVIISRINNLYSFNYRSENEWPGSNTRWANPMHLFPTNQKCILQLTKFTGKHTTIIPKKYT
jgi:uncharacterized surface protein with fasciclin (FAS1) repeats